jgi:FkbM family methyltransferase
MWRSLRVGLFGPAVFGDSNETAQIGAYLGAKPGVFIEVGAYDPTELSQTHHLETAGWTGILIEPQRECAERLRHLRKARVFELAAGAPEQEGRSLPFQIAGALSTLQPSIKALDVQATEVRLVPVRTLDSIIADAKIDKVDFVSIDVEGAELNVLRGFSLSKYCPRLVLIEDDVHQLDKHRHMEAHGYKLVRRTALNNWYVPRDASFPISFLGRIQMFRKLYLGLWPRRLKYAIAAWRRRQALLPQG